MQHHTEIAQLLTSYGQSPGDIDLVFFLMQSGGSNVRSARNNGYPGLLHTRDAASGRIPARPDSVSPYPKQHNNGCNQCHRQGRLL